MLLGQHGIEGFFLCLDYVAFEGFFSVKLDGKM